MRQNVPLGPAATHTTTSSGGQPRRPSSLSAWLASLGASISSLCRRCSQCIQKFAGRPSAPDHWSCPIPSFPSVTTQPPSSHPPPADTQLPSQTGAVAAAAGGLREQQRDSQVSRGVSSEEPQGEDRLVEETSPVYRLSHRRRCPLLYIPGGPQCHDSCRSHPRKSEGSGAGSV
ncbi:unnamed protein product [Vitrella brassicaformis CCMP3155]|uniref:Uncharacterized protein n=1 Tax=Vitrella brassicaformis (strain CCMP3155) TaxID=1169540 RepID=A0A0G4EHD9_VITBC|nr:unnamed protein product [Vitrella brassicaformis CCMP3155]|eukprot:CEL95398.1 unnamed protein product [Vitrella brassicaformis CCMP3155]